MIQELEENKNEIVESYELAEITDISERFEKEIQINENLTIVVEKAMDTKNPEILLAFSGDMFGFEGYRTDLEDFYPEITGFFDQLFNDFFYFCEYKGYTDCYYWVAC